MNLRRPLGLAVGLGLVVITLAGCRAGSTATRATLTSSPIVTPTPVVSTATTQVQLAATATQIPPTTVPTKAPPTFTPISAQPTAAPTPTIVAKTVTPAAQVDDRKQVKMQFVEGSTPVKGKEIWLGYYDPSTARWEIQSKTTGEDGMAIFRIPTVRSGASAAFTYALSEAKVNENANAINKNSMLGYSTPADVGIKIDANLRSTITEGSIQMTTP